MRAHALQTEAMLEEWPEATCTQTEEEYIVPVYEPPPKQCHEIAVQCDNEELQPRPEMVDCETATSTEVSTGSSWEGCQSLEGIGCQYTEAADNLVTPPGIPALECNCFDGGLGDPRHRQRVCCRPWWSCRMTGWLPSSRRSTRPCCANLLPLNRYCLSA